jgi:hypothetical protein
VVAIINASIVQQVGIKHYICNEATRKCAILKNRRVVGWIDCWLFIRLKNTDRNRRMER